MVGGTGAFYNKSEALEPEGQTTDEVGEGPSEIVRPPKTIPPVPCINISSVNRKSSVVVIGDSFLRGAEVLIRRLDPTHREVCCLPGAQRRDITGKLSSLVRPSEYYPLFVVQTGREEITKRTLRAIKRGFGALG